MAIQILNTQNMTVCCGSKIEFVTVLMIILAINHKFQYFFAKFTYKLVQRN